MNAQRMYDRMDRENAEYDEAIRRFLRSNKHRNNRDKLKSMKSKIMTATNPHRPARAALPKARVVYANHGDLALPVSLKVFPTKDSREHIVAHAPCLLTAFPTVSQARTAARWVNLGEEEKVERIAETLAYNVGSTYAKLPTDFQEDYRIDARRILLTLTGHAPKSK